MCFLDLDRMWDGIFSKGDGQSVGYSVANDNLVPMPPARYRHVMDRDETAHPRKDVCELQTESKNPWKYEKENKDLSRLETVKQLFHAFINR